MSSTDRLQRYLADEEGACGNEQLQARLAELDELHSAVDENIETDVAVLSALANETRYTILRLLHIADEELCVCEITPFVDVSDSAISHALSQLNEAGLITRRKEGKWRKCEATPRAHALLVGLDGSRGL